jgi:hypothetical protein
MSLDEKRLPTLGLIPLMGASPPTLAFRPVDPPGQTHQSTVQGKQPPSIQYARWQSLKAVHPIHR